jgi:hypothetical protein
MKQFIIAVAMLSVANVSALAQNQNRQGSNNNNQGGSGHYGAPGPLIGAGPVGLVIGVGYGVYWLVKRRRRKTEV